LNTAISRYNTTQAGQPTPAGQQLVSSGLFTAAQLNAIGLVAPTLSLAPSNQLTFPWVKAFDFKLDWVHTFSLGDHPLTIIPSIGLYNLFNFSNFNLPPGAMTGWLNQGNSSINSTIHGYDPTTNTVPSDTFRVGAGTGVFGLGSPRTMEFSLKLTF
jgi:hypothetical protein